MVGRDRSAYWKARSAERRLSPEYRAAQSSVYRAWRERNPLTDEDRARSAENQRRYREDHNLQAHRDARRLVRNAIRRGELVRMGCELCGEPKVDAHHDDYGKPLEVRWLCRPHHVEYHNQVRAKATQP